MTPARRALDVWRCLLCPARGRAADGSLAYTGHWRRAHSPEAHIQAVWPA